jgi:hypothetical protein
MDLFIEISSMISGIASGVSGDFFTGFFSSFEWNTLLLLGGGPVHAFALGAITYDDIPEEVIARIRCWHGSIDEQFTNINNAAGILEEHKTEWTIPDKLLEQLNENRSQLNTLILKCRSSAGSSADRTHRNSLLKSTVGICLSQLKSWAIMQYYEGMLTADDVHLLGFFLPGDASGHRDRKEPTDDLPEVKASVINMDNIRVVIDQASTENAAQVRHGWPRGVRQALIVILSADGSTEVYRQMTSHLHTDIEMPAGSRGKLFIIKAAFLRHVDDRPKFGNEPTFFMPLTTEDLASIVDRQHHEEFEEHVRETERHRQEIERLNAEKDNEKYREE